MLVIIVFGKAFLFGVMSNGQFKFEGKVFDYKENVELPVLLVGTKRLSYPLGSDLDNPNEEKLLRSDMNLTDGNIQDCTMTPILVVAPKSCENFYVKVKVADSWLDRTSHPCDNFTGEIVLKICTRIHELTRIDQSIVKNKNIGGRGRFMTVSMPCKKDCRQCSGNHKFKHPGKCLSFDCVEKGVEEFAGQENFLARRNCFFHAFITMKGEKKREKLQTETYSSHGFASMNVANHDNSDVTLKFANLMTSGEAWKPVRFVKKESSSYSLSKPHSVRIYLVMEDQGAIIEESDYVQRSQEKMNKLGYY